MKIRLANKFDLPSVVEMLRNFRNNTPIEMMRECNNEEYINKLFHHIILGGGVALIAEDKNTAGMIIGVKDQNVWDPNLKVLRELVYWVEPQYRGSTAGYKLLLQYNKLAQELIDENKISMYTMTKIVNSPDLDFTKFGYKKAEEVWVGGV
jgi:N-acetylglutamate synthase-like GNAT family acetyltransferase